MVRLHFVGAGWAEIVVLIAIPPPAPTQRTNNFRALERLHCADLSLAGWAVGAWAKVKVRGLVAFLPEHHVHAIPALGREVVQRLHAARVQVGEH